MNHSPFHARLNGAVMTDQREHVFLVDGSGFIFRAYHALPPMTRRTARRPMRYSVSPRC